jgi:uncharacterized protein
MKKNIYISFLTTLLIGLILTSCTLKTSFVIPPSLQASEPVSQTTAPSLQKIALLLPLSGTFAASGKAVHDGFLAAYHESRKHGQTDLSITVVDTKSGNIKELYKQLINQGTEFFIGPLTKSEVENIATEPLLVPTLVLNTIDSYTTNKISNLYQFGLSSRDEATQIAKKAWNNNLHQALIVVPDTARGRNLATTLNDAWRYFGGTVKTTVLYTDITSANQNIREVLNLNVDKNSKHHTKFKPYEGNDIDVVFLIASPEQGRAVQPLLRFYINPNIPVYATSDIYNGTMQANLDIDLEGITFCDIPWILQADKLEEPLASLQRNTYDRSHVRLYALGIDAYYLMLNLKQISSNSNAAFNGATGLLSMDKYQHVYRTLNFAQIRNGIAVLVP